MQAPEARPGYIETIDDRPRSIDYIEWPLTLVHLQDRAFAGYRLVTPDYFETVRTALVEGRGFGNGDPKQTVVVSRNLAERAWPGQAAVGRQLAANPWGGGNQPFEVIGVVEDVHYSNLSEPPEEAIYFDAKGWAWTDWEVLLAVRVDTDPSALIAPIRDVIRSMDSEIPMAEARPWKDYVRDHLATNRFALMLIGLFAIVAAALAAIGLYGVLSYSVSQRTKEMGIRIALGSERSDILRLVLRQGMALAVTGVVLGVLGAVGLTRFLSTFLYGVTATDPQTFIVIAGGLSIVAAVACYLPARRATRLDPMSVLRTE